MNSLEIYNYEKSIDILIESKLQNQIIRFVVAVDDSGCPIGPVHAVHDPKRIMGGHRGIKAYLEIEKAAGGWFFFEGTKIVYDNTLIHSTGSLEAIAAETFFQAVKEFGMSFLIHISHEPKPRWN